MSLKLQCVLAFAAAVAVWPAGADAQCMRGGSPGGGGGASFAGRGGPGGPGGGRMSGGAGGSTQMMQFAQQAMQARMQQRQKTQAYQQQAYFQMLAQRNRQQPRATARVSNASLAMQSNGTQQRRQTKREKLVARLKARADQRRKLRESRRGSPSNGPEA